MGRGGWLLLAALLLLVCAAAVAEPRIRVAREVAEWRWGPVCNGHYTIRKAPLPPDYLAYSSSSSDAEGNRVDCRVTFAARHRFPWWQLCRVLTHEAGHLAGYRAKHPYRDRRGHVDWAHSALPHSLMYPFTWEPYRPCGPDHNHPRIGSYGL